jgi:zinc/manganese transport system permease protein
MSQTPTLTFDLLADLRELLQFRFMVSALEAGAIVAVLAAVVGWYTVLRRQAFAGHTLSVMAFPGATGAALAGIPGALGYYAACSAAALAIARTGRGGRSARGGETAVIGTVQSVGLALGFLFLSLNSAVLEGPETLLFGTFLGITRGEVVGLLAVAAGVLLTLAVIGRPLLTATLDREFARARGVPVAVLDLIFLLLLGFAVAATSQITGVLLVFGLLIAPPASAQLLTSRPLLGLVLSVVFALLIVWLALAVAYFSIYPVGFFTSTFAFVLYVVTRAATSRRHAAHS